MANQESHLPDLFHALADPTRLAVIDALASGEQPVSQLAEPYDMALPSFMKHLKVLEGADLISSRKSGRVRLVRLCPETLSGVDLWFADRRHLWQARLNALATYLDETKDDLND